MDDRLLIDSQLQEYRREIFMRVYIRDAHSQDIPAILDIWEDYMSLLHQTNSHYWKMQDAADAFAAYLEKTFEMEEVRLLVAVDTTRKVTGFTLSHMECLPEWFGARPIGFIRYMAVDKDYRGKGIGRKMTVDAVRWFAESGIERIELFVLNGLDAGEFWGKMGFESFMDRRFLDLS